MKRILASAAFLVSCAASQPRLARFSTEWEDDGGASIGHLWHRLGGTPIAPAADVVVGVAANTDTLIGLPLGGGPKWTFGHALDVRPTVSGRVVVAAGGGEVFALDTETGRLLWRRPTDGAALLGAGDDGAVTVVTLRRAGGLGSTLLAVGHDGVVVRQIESEKGLGVPAVLGRTAFVPWAGQYVSAIDLDSGDETARVTLRAETSRAWTAGGSLWFGEASFIRFDEHIVDASRGRASTAILPVRELPGMPRVMPPGTAPVPPQATAEDKARMYASPVATSQGAAVEDGRWYATYFRIAMGFDATTAERDPKRAQPSASRAAGADASRESGKLLWVHLHAADLLGGAAAAGGLVLCDERGIVTGLDSGTGAVLTQADLGGPLKACVVSVDSQRVAGVAAEVKPLPAQLAEAVLADDPQLVVAQRLLLRELAAVSDDSATKALVELASDARTSPDLLADARKAIANRRNGASYMEAALARHYEYLKDVLRSPPVGPMAQALGAMKDTAAAPLLASHLFDPADTDDDVLRAAAALSVIGGPGEVVALRRFFGMYRASAGNDEIAAAVVSAGRALLTLDDQGGRGVVEAAAAASDTIPYARERLQAMLSETQPGEVTGANDGGGKKGK
ncbi:MAG: PQQ-binding-like beta-propeller repeat protein [Polyangiaceae bacterium]